MQSIQPMLSCYVAIIINKYDEIPAYFDLAKHIIWAEMPLPLNLLFVQKHLGSTSPNTFA